MKTTFIMCGAALALPFAASAQIFTETFDTAGSSANWNVQADADTAVEFGWDYSALGIPAAPNGTGTTGVRMAANISNGSAAGLSMTPIGLSLPSDYVVSFDMWINVNGPHPGGGSGSTEFGTYGVGSAGSGAQWGGVSGQTFAVSGEGHSASDYRVYNEGSLVDGGLGVYAAEDHVDPEGDSPRNQFHEYYELNFPGQTAPVAQQNDFAQQNEDPLNDGTQGFAWREVQIQVAGTTVEWGIDGHAIATVTDFDGTGDPFVGYFDAFSSLSDNPDLSFGVVDNFQVIPEPSTYAMIFGLVAGAAMLVHRRRKNRA